MNFKVGISNDLRGVGSEFSWGNVSIETLAPLNWEFLSPVENNFCAEDLSGYNAVAFAQPGIDEESFSESIISPTIMARFGVGYDNIDLDACTRAGVALTITPDGSQKPVATAALTLLLATMHRIVAKDAQARIGDWKGRINGLGQGLNGKKIGTIGLGNIASEFFRLLSPFDVSKFAYDPYKSSEDAANIGVKLISLFELMQNCDAIVILAALSRENRHLIGKREIEMMKVNAVLINISRGPLIDESALIYALENQKIAGAGLDVFETEPADPQNLLFKLSNVITTPHNLAWTDELALGMGKSAFTAIKEIRMGRIPKYVVNQEVLTTEKFKKKISEILL